MNLEYIVIHLTFNSIGRQWIRIVRIELIEKFEITFNLMRKNRWIINFYYYVVEWHCWIEILGAVAEILDSLDDVEVLQESGRLMRGEILSAIDDYPLRAVLEV